MKKCFILLLLVLLSACSSQTSVTALTNETVAVDQGVVELIKTTFIVDDGTSLEVSEGYQVVNCDKKETVNSDFVLYPVYQNQQLTNFVLKSSKNVICNVSEEIREKLNDSFAIVEVSGNVYLLASGEYFKIYGLKAIEENKMKKLLSETELLTKFTKESITTIKQGILTADNRIVVRFVEGDGDEYVAQYSKVCNGTMISFNQTTGNYVFAFEPLKDDQLQALLEKTKQLEYVKEAFLDGLNELNSTTNQAQ